MVEHRYLGPTAQGAKQPSSACPSQVLFACIHPQSRAGEGAGERLVLASVSDVRSF